VLRVGQQLLRTQHQKQTLIALMCCAVPIIALLMLFEHTSQQRDSKLISPMRQPHRVSETATQSVAPFS
jgi:hypothetical protein